MTCYIRKPANRNQVAAQVMNFSKFKVKGAIANINAAINVSYLPEEVKARLAIGIVHLDLALEEWPTKLPDNWERLQGEV